jgi:hypothetical protein
VAGCLSFVHRNLKAYNRGLSYYIRLRGGFHTGRACERK